MFVSLNISNYKNHAKKFTREWGLIFNFVNKGIDLYACMKDLKFFHLI